MKNKPSLFQFGQKARSDLACMGARSVDKSGGLEMNADTQETANTQNPELLAKRRRRIGMLIFALIGVCLAPVCIMANGLMNGTIQKAGHQLWGLSLLNLVAVVAALISIWLIGRKDSLLCYVPAAIVYLYLGHGYATVDLNDRSTAFVVGLLPLYSINLIIDFTILAFLYLWIRSRFVPKKDSAPAPGGREE